MKFVNVCFFNVFRVDIDNDQNLTKDELLNYVLKNIELHLREAKQRNSQLFLLIDSNKDGKVTWNEYFSLYVKFHKLNDTKIKESDFSELLQKPFDNDCKTN